MACVVTEERTAVCTQLLAEDPLVVTWWGSWLEGAATIRRKQRAGEIAADKLPGGLQQLAALMAHATVIEAGGELRSRALRLLGGHPLGSGDALQLAAALTWCADRSEGHAFVTLDQRLAKSALAEGFEVLPAVR